MATSKAKKSNQLEVLTDKFKNGVGFAFAEFNELTVNEAQAARRALRAKGMSYTVIKKTLIALAAKNAGVAEFSADDLQGAVAVIISTEDAIAPASNIKDLIKEHFNKASKTSKFGFAGAVFEGKFLDPEATAQLANTPSREESLAKIVATMRKGPQGIHAGLTHGLRGITMALKEANVFTKA